jgi:SPP1 gp7 family putative phage head morphogenesis protein
MSDVLNIVARFRAALLSREERAQAEVLRAYEAAWGSITEQLADLTRRLEAPSDGGASPSLRIEQQRLRELERQVVEAILEVGRTAADVVAREQAALVLAAERQAAALTQAAATGRAAVVAANFNSLPVDVIERLVGVASDGSPVRASFARLARDLGLETGDRITHALIQGAALGSNPTEIARSLRREADAKGDNVMRQPAVVRRLNQAVRTESYRALREATRESYKENEQLVQKWRWVAALSPSTCSVCWAMHGKTFSLDVPLQSHIACRCVMVPVLDAEETFETGAEKFAKLEPGFQQQILGSDVAHEAYVSGDVRLEDFVGLRDSDRWGLSRYRRSLREIRGARVA